MKQSQWIAVLFLAAAVFGVTFAWNYVGNLGGRKQPKARVAQSERDPELTFPTRTFPPSGNADQERLKEGGHNFLFFNEEVKPLTVGLAGKNCRCVRVDLLVLPAEAGVEWRNRKMGGFASQMAAATAACAPLGPGLPFVGAPMVLALPPVTEGDSRLRELEAQAEVTSLLEHKEGATVPAGAVGWVRLGWSSDRSNLSPVTTLKATLWMNKHSTATELRAQLHFHEPLRVRQDDRVHRMGKFDVRGFTHHDKIVCWSSTRPSLRIQTKLIGLYKDQANDPLTVGEPVAMTPAECKEWERDLSQSADLGQVMCAYRIPITLRERGTDGKTLVDLGPLSRFLTVSLADDDGQEPITINLRSLITGDVSVGDGDKDWIVRLNSFYRSQGSHKFINVRSDTPGLKLEIDKTRTAGFLEAHLKPEATASQGEPQRWSLEVRVPPDRVSGNFPREDDPEYRDSAVYLRTVGPSPRSIRIPVEGSATQR